LVLVQPLRGVDPAGEAGMTPGLRLPWATPGARLHLPRDLHLAYIIGRMGVACSADVWPLLFGSRVAAKIGFARLQRLGLLRLFPRRNPSELGWYGLVPDAAPWVAEAMGCDDVELRVVHGVARMNLQAVRARNRLWVSVVQACRAVPDARVALVRPEWELRRARTPGTRLVPDAQLVLETRVGGQAAEAAWFVELDHGTERLAVWEAKARTYLDARQAGSLYGEPSWRILAIVPTARRARSVASAARRVGAGSVLWLALQEQIEEGRALGPHLWRADELGDAGPVPATAWSLIGTSPIRDPDPRPRSAADMASPTASRAVSG
jgi:hypothetical protein